MQKAHPNRAGRPLCFIGDVKLFLFQLLEVLRTIHIESTTELTDFLQVNITGKAQQGKCCVVRFSSHRKDGPPAPGQRATDSVRSELPPRPSELFPSQLP